MQQIDTLPPYHALTDIVIDTTSDSLGAMPKALCVYDSIFTPLEQAEPVVRKSLFTHHQLEVKHNHEMEIHHQGVSGWYFGFIALSIFMICTYLRTKQIGLLTLLQSAIDHRALGRMLRETNLTHAPDQAPIALLMLLPVTLVGYFFFFSHPENIWYDILHYLLLYVASIVIYFTRNGIFRFIGNAFNNSESIHIYLSSNYIYHLLYAIAASALAFFVCYTDRVGPIFFYMANTFYQHFALKHLAKYLLD